jgi:hypothetical protein
MPVLLLKSVADRTSPFPGRTDQSQEALDGPRRLTQRHAGHHPYRQASRIAASSQSGSRPRLPVAAAPQVIAGPTRIVSEPRRKNASLLDGQDLVSQAGGVGLVMSFGDHNGITR